jgi:serine/threonine protein phosphatase PrpC
MPFVRHSRRHGYRSISGRRAINEDRAATLALGGNRYVAVVADGMGGARAGGVASNAALTAFVSSIRSANGGGERAMLQTAFAAADLAIREASTPERQGMGSTLVAAIAHGDDLWIGNIGDSRAVLITSDEVIPLSTEHSVVGEALRKGEITELEAYRHPERHVISRAIGEGDARPDMTFHALTHGAGSGSVVLLGSDGLFNFVGDSELLELTAGARTAAAIVENVVRRAVDNGSDDNVTAAAILLDPPRLRRVALLTLLILLAIGAAAFSKRHEIGRLLPAGFAHFRTASVIAERTDARQITRWRFPAGGERHLKAGMTGSLCARDNCFASWRVVAADRSSVVLEISVNDIRARKPKS